MDLPGLTHSINSEYDSLVENKCWESVPRIPNSKVISSKWVYKTKEERTTDGALGIRRKSGFVIHIRSLGMERNPADGCVYMRCKGVQILIFALHVDADWAGDRESRKSMSGFVGMMGGVAVAWCARQQEVVAISSAESEYIFMCSGAKETVWLRGLVDGLGVVRGMDGSTKMFVDNQAAIELVHNASVNRRNKHIDVRFNFSRQLVEDKKLELEYYPAEDMVADVFTKALGRVKLHRFVGMLGMAGRRSALDM